MRACAKLVWSESHASVFIYGATLTLRSVPKRQQSVRGYGPLFITREGLYPLLPAQRTFFAQPAERRNKARGEF